MVFFSSNTSNLLPPNIRASDSTVVAATTAAASATGTNFVTANGTGVEDRVTAASSTTAADVAKAIVTAVPEASLADKAIEGGVTDANTNTTTDVANVVRTADGTNLVTANGTGVEDGVTAASSTTAADVAKAVVTAVPQASLNDINSLNVTDEAAVSSLGSDDVVSPPFLDRISSNLRSTKSTRKPVTQKYNKKVAASIVMSSKKGVANNNCSFTNERHGNSLSITQTPKRPKYIDLDNYESTAVPSLKDNSSSDDMGSHESSTTSIPSILQAISNVIPYPVKVWSHTCTDITLSSYLDVVDLSATPCCGYLYMLRMVDPVSRYGHVVPLKSSSSDNIIDALNRLMMVCRVKPTTLFYSPSLSFVADVSNQYPSVQFVEREHNETMNLERDLFLKQLNKWIKSNHNWVTGAAVVQAVTNTLPIPPPHD